MRRIRIDAPLSLAWTHRQRRRTAVMRGVIATVGSDPDNNDQHKMFRLLASQVSVVLRCSYWCCAFRYTNQGDASCALRRLLLLVGW